MRYILSLSLLLSSLSASALTTLDDVRSEITGLETLLTASQNQSGDAGKNETILDATTTDAINGVTYDIGLLNAGDYNTLLIESLQRYTKAPKARPLIFSLWQNVGKFLALDFESQGYDFWSSSAKGLLFYGSLFALARSPVYWLLRSNAAIATWEFNYRNALWKIPILRGVEITKQTRDVIALYGTGIIVANGYDALQATLQTHRLDPRPAFEIQTVTLGCELQSIVTDQNITDVAQLKELASQATTLMKENADLENVVINGTRIQDALAKVRTEAQLQKFFPKDISCEAVRLNQVVTILNDKLATLEPPK